MLDEIQKTENLHSHEYGAIGKEVKDGELFVTGESAVAERAEGIGGYFTCRVLGEAVEIHKVLSGEAHPSYGALGAALFHMATNRALDPARLRESDSYLGHVKGRPHAQNHQARRRHWIANRALAACPSQGVSNKGCYPPVAQEGRHRGFRSAVLVPNRTVPRTQIGHRFDHRWAPCSRVAGACWQPNRFVEVSQRPGAEKGSLKSLRRSATIRKTLVELCSS